MKKQKSLKDVRSKRHKKQEVPVVELVSIHDEKVVVRVCGQVKELEYGSFNDMPKSVEKYSGLIDYDFKTRHFDYFGIFHVAEKWCKTAGIEYKEGVNGIRWEYTEGREAIIYRYPWKVGFGNVYFGEIFDTKERCSSCKFIDTDGAKAFIDEATKKIEELERTGETRDAHESER